MGRHQLGICLAQEKCEVHTEGKAQPYDDSVLAIKQLNYFGLPEEKNYSFPVNGDNNN